MSAPPMRVPPGPGPSRTGGGAAVTQARRIADDRRVHRGGTRADPQRGRPGSGDARREVVRLGIEANRPWWWSAKAPAAKRTRQPNWVCGYCQRRSSRRCFRHTPPWTLTRSRKSSPGRGSRSAQALAAWTRWSS